MPRGAARRSSASPLMSSELTGSSNQVTSCSATRSAMPSASFAANAPLASTKSPAAPRSACRRDPRGIAPLVAADLHLDPAAAVALDPTGKLLAQPVVRIAGEAAAAVDRHPVADLAEQRCDRDTKQLCLQIPQRDIDCRDRRGDEPRTRLRTPRHCAAPVPCDIERAASGHDRRQLVLDQCDDRCVAVSVAKSGCAARLDLDHHQNCSILLQCAVGLRRVGEDFICRCRNPFESPLGAHLFPLAR
jgi:hypothetical protein